MTVYIPAVAVCARSEIRKRKNYALDGEGQHLGRDQPAQPWTWVCVDFSGSGARAGWTP